MVLLPLQQFFPLIAGGFIAFFFSDYLISFVSLFFPISPGLLNIARFLSFILLFSIVVITIEKCLRFPCFTRPKIK